MVAAVVVVIGLVIGSFLNVVIARVPERRSLVHPRSACPGCGAMIAWYDNIPILSFLALRGRCRACAMPIPWRYPLVEGRDGRALPGRRTWRSDRRRTPSWRRRSWPRWWRSRPSIFEYQIIPDVISLPGILAGCLANLATGRVPWVDSLLGIVVGGGVFHGYHPRPSGGRNGRGRHEAGRDARCLPRLESRPGRGFRCRRPRRHLALALLASGKRGRKDPIPFGPFLAAGGAAGLFYGERVVRWYLGGFGGF